MSDSPKYPAEFTDCAQCEHERTVPCHSYRESPTKGRCVCGHTPEQHATAD